MIIFLTVEDDDEKYACDEIMIISPFISTASTKPSRRRRTAGRLPRAIWKKWDQYNFPFYKINILIVFLQNCSLQKTENLWFEHQALLL